MFLQILTKRGRGKYWWLLKICKKNRLAVISGHGSKYIMTDKNRDTKTFHSNSRTCNNRQMLSVLSILSQERGRLWDVGYLWHESHELCELHNFVPSKKWWKTKDFPFFGRLLLEHAKTKISLWLYISPVFNMFSIHCVTYVSPLKLMKRGVLETRKIVTGSTWDFQKAKLIHPWPGSLRWIPDRILVFIALSAQTDSPPKYDQDFTHN